MPLNFHEFHELFWIREIKFVKCYSYIEVSGKNLSKNAWIREILNTNIQFLKYTSVKITPYTVLKPTDSYQQRGMLLQFLMAHMHV